MKHSFFLLLLLLHNTLLVSLPPVYEQAQGIWAEKTLASLTLREKIGQLFVVATASCFEQQEEALASELFKTPYKMDPNYIKWLIAEYKIGGLIFLFKSSPDKQIDAVNEYQALSKTPLLISQDCEWGLSMRLYNTLNYPRNADLGKLENINLVYELGKEIGRQCKAVGVHMNFAPVVDVNNDPSNKVIRSRSFGDNPTFVAHAGLLMMCGLQDAGVLACAKHFSGHGDTALDSHFDLPLIMHSKDHLQDCELIPFKHLINHGVAGVMSAHLAIPALEEDTCRASSISHAIVTDLLAGELDFKGLKITDGLGMHAITKYYEPGIIEFEAALAGNDIILCPLDVPKAVDLIEQAIYLGKITEHDLDTRVLKILKAKEWAGCHMFVSIDKETAVAQLHTSVGYELQEKIYSALSSAL